MSKDICYTRTRTHAQTRTRARTHTHARAHAHTHTHARTHRAKRAMLTLMVQPMETPHHDPKTHATTTAAPRLGPALRGARGRPGQDGRAMRNKGDCDASKGSERRFGCVHGSRGRLRG